jgi:hypothetical protein
VQWGRPKRSKKLCLKVELSLKVEVRSPIGGVQRRAAELLHLTDITHICCPQRDMRVT